jgi:hypothetical protein
VALGAAAVAVWTELAAGVALADGVVEVGLAAAVAEVGLAGAGAAWAGVVDAEAGMAGDFVAAGWPVPAGAVALPCAAVELTGLTWGDVPGGTAWVTDEAAEPTAWRTPDAPAGAVAPEAVAPEAADAEEAGAVSAWAWREKSTRMARIPAASSAAWTARRAICRTTA